MSENFRQEEPNLENPPIEQKGEESPFNCSFCEDVGTCSYCKRGQEEAQKLKDHNIWKKIRASGKKPRKKAA